MIQRQGKCKRRLPDGLFILLPAAREGTVEPALVKDGRVLSQGVACVNTEG